MPISIACPECGQTINPDSSEAGSVHRCLSCGAEFEVTIYVAPRAEEVVAMVADDAPAGEEEVVAQVLAEPVDPLVTAAPAPRRGALSPVEMNPELASAQLTNDRVARYRELYSKDAKVPIWGWFATVSISVLPILAWAWNLNGIRDSFSPPSAPEIAGEGFENLQQAKYRAELGEEKPLAEVYQAIEAGIVKIETRDEQGKMSGVGAGFVIDPSGLIATNLHVLSDTAEADVVFNDGKRYPIEGYAAISRESDLAIVKLKKQPAELTVLKLDETKLLPRTATPVVAIGHPQNHAYVPTSGKVVRVVKSSELPATAQKFLHYAPSELDNVWIEHDASISPGSSGGPLVDHDGTVLGINTWVNPDLKLGYALHAQHLVLLKSQAQPKLTPLAEIKPQ